MQERKGKSAFLFMCFSVSSVYTTVTLPLPVPSPYAISFLPYPYPYPFLQLLPSLCPFPPFPTYLRRRQSFQAGCFLPRRSWPSFPPSFPRGWGMGGEHRPSLNSIFSLHLLQKSTLLGEADISDTPSFSGTVNHHMLKNARAAALPPISEQHPVGCSCLNNVIVFPTVAFNARLQPTRRVYEYASKQASKQQAGQQDIADRPTRYPCHPPFQPRRIVTPRSQLAFPCWHRLTPGPRFDRYPDNNPAQGGTQERMGQHDWQTAHVALREPQLIPKHANQGPIKWARTRL
ncbi:hypothetical protein LZ31DRAFT_22474 [Colletotrichum somersetense]|nr:hypothetical protein LZ31DRAFT_22474 [Colletotrichum somersetense]